MSGLLNFKPGDLLFARDIRSTDPTKDVMQAFVINM